jgi:RNA polymerase sigma factor (sigma-70 family)
VDTFEQHRDHLWAVAFRMLGTRSDADDAVQETWLRLNRSDVSEVRNLRGWLTTVIAHICLDVLRARSTRRDESLDAHADLAAPASVGPEQQAVLADSVGVALLVVLQTLTPPERLALVLHDMFDVPFAEIGSIVGRSPNAAAQLAARARRRVRGRTPDSEGMHGHRRVVEAFLAAARDGEFDALLAVLHDDVELRVDGAATPSGEVLTVHGSNDVAARARMFAANARFAELALVDGDVGVVVAPDGSLVLVLQFAVAEAVITRIDITAERDRLDRLELAVLD